MAYRIDDEENRTQDIIDGLEDKINEITASPIVGRNISTRATGADSASGAARNQFPSLPPIRDFGTIGLVTQEIVLNRVDSHVSKFIINGDVDFAFSEPPSDQKMMQFVMDVTIDSIGGYTINLPPQLEPATLSIDNTADARTILLIQTTDGGVTFQGQDIFDTGGGGDISFPIRPPIDDRGSVSTDQVFILSDTDGHVLKFTATADLEVTFNSFPILGFQQEWEVEVTQDSTGGRVVTFPQVLNPPTLDTTADTTTVITFRTNDAGGTIRVGNAVATGAQVTALSDLTIDVTKNWLGLGISNFGNLTGVTGIDLDGATATIIGAQLIDFFQTDQSIESLFTGIEYTAGDLQAHSFIVDGITVAQFEEIGTSTFRLDMLDHQIKDALHITFSNASGAPIFAGTSPAIGFNSVTSTLLINYPTGAKIGISANNVVGSTEIFLDSIISDVLTADSDLFIGILGTSPPTVTGQFTNDATDVFVFSGGESRNMSDIGAVTGANTELSNLDAVTLINTSLVSDTANTDDLGSALIPWRIAHIKQLQFDGDSNDPTNLSDTQITKSVTGTMQFNVSPSTAKYLWFFDPVTPGAVWEMSSTQLIGNGAGILIDQSLTFNDSTTNPIGNGELTRNGDDMKIFADNFELRNTLIGSSGTANFVSYRRNTTNASSGDELGSIRFDGSNASNVQTAYAQVLAGISDLPGSGVLALRVRADNSGLITGLQLEGDEDVASRTYLTVNSIINSNLLFGNENGVGGTFKIGVDSVEGAGANTTLGLVVEDNVSYTVGSSGTLAMPVEPSLSPTLATLNAAFGTHDGAMGIFDTSAANVIVAIRARSDEWILLSVPSGGGTVLGEHINA